VLATGNKSTAATAATMVETFMGTSSMIDKRCSRGDDNGY
jgi:hypothetical protein